MRGRLMLATTALLLLLGCSRSTAPQTDSAASSASSAPAAAPFKVPAQPVSSPKVDGNRALQYTKEIVAFGARPSGSPALKQVQDYIVAKVKDAGADVSFDDFTATTPAGKFPIRNIIAKFHGTKDGVILLGSHYETNYPLPKQYVGANDGAATSALLLELANQLKGEMKNGKREGYSVWLVFFDGEEAFKEWGPDDSLYGSKHLASVWQHDGTLKKVKAMLLLDMIGDADLNVDRDTSSDQSLADLAGAAAQQLTVSSHFFARELAIDDDHKPFAAAGVPVLDLIDFSYGYNNAFHHTTNDTVDKLSPKSLEIVGNVVLRTVAMLDQQ